MSVSVVLKNVTSTIGEGPHWVDSTSQLLYVDILANDLHRWNYSTNKDEKLHFDESVSLVVPDTKGGYVISVGRTLTRLDWDTHSLNPLTPEVDQGSNNRFNDGKCDPSGRLWAGTMDNVSDPTKLIPDAGSLYLLDKDQTLKQKLDKIGISNGLAWTEDNRTMYYIDSIPRKVFAFDFDNNTGDISNRRVAMDFSTSSIADFGYPDGMSIDTEGKLWVACYFGGKVVRVDPQTGTVVQRVLIPDATRITSCCFGGPNLDELFVTSSCAGVKEEEFKTTESLAGSLFKVTGLGIKGWPAYSYLG